MRKKSISIIGSFRKHFKEITNVRDLFKINDLEILSPRGNSILQDDIEFVRFDTDEENKSDEMIQSITLKRIFSSDAVYVYVHNGYIGRTTCYEVGRIIQRKQPIYFSSQPLDLPILIPQKFIVPPLEFIKILSNNEEEYLYKQPNCEISLLESSL